MTHVPGEAGERLVYASPDLLLDTALAPLQEAEELAALDYTHYPYIERRWVEPGYVPVGSPVIYAAGGETGKGLLMCAKAARVVLGLPFPGEDQALRRAPGQVVWISGVGEDDQFEDMAPRLRAAIAYAVGQFGLDPELATEEGAIRLVRDLSQWRDDTPVTLPKDCPAILAEIGRIDKLAKRDGRPPVAMVVADSLSALLSEGFTIDSRQGARKVMAKLSGFARRADVAMVLIHHLTKDGKVAGSPAVLDSLRLAFIIERDKVNEDVRTIIRHKSNISTAEPLRYVIAGSGASTRAEFISGADARTERIEHARAAAAPEAGSLRARALAAAADPGPFHVMVRQDGATRLVGTPVATRGDARALADADAGRVLSWQSAPALPRTELAHCRQGEVTVGYLVGPVRQ